MVLTHILHWCTVCSTMISLQQPSSGDRGSPTAYTQRDPIPIAYSRCPALTRTKRADHGTLSQTRILIHSSVHGSEMTVDQLISRAKSGNLKTLELLHKLYTMEWRKEYLWTTTGRWTAFCELEYGTSVFIKRVACPYWVRTDRLLYLNISHNRPQNKHYKWQQLYLHLPFRIILNSSSHVPRGADKSLARPEWKKNFVRRGGHCFQGDPVGRTIFWFFCFWSGLEKSELGCCSLFPSWFGQGRIRVRTKKNCG